jgi:hypothetical protein
MREEDRMPTLLKRLEPTRDRLSHRDDFQKLDAAVFFHVKLSPKGGRSSISRSLHGLGSRASFLA